MSKTSDTTVDRKRVDGRILLKDNDLIEIGQRQFIFHSLFPDAPGSAKVSQHLHQHLSPCETWQPRAVWARPDAGSASLMRPSLDG
jgi:hypothetical protein